MGVQTIDTIGIVNFVIYVPLTLFACFILLTSNIILEYLKNLIQFAEIYIYYFIILIISLILILASIIIYSNSINQLQQAYILGQRMQDECKNTYSIVDTPNYQLKLVLDDPNGPNNMIHIASIIMYIAIICIFLSIVADNITKKKNPNDNYSLIIKVILGIYPLIGIFFIILECLHKYKNLSLPAYLDKTHTVPFTVILAFATVFIGFMTQYYYYSNRMQPYSFILILVSLIAFILIYITQNDALKTSITNDYKNLTAIDGKNPKEKDGGNTIAKDIVAIGTIDTPGSNFVTYKNLPAQPKTPFTMYLMENIKADPQWRKRTPDDNTPLWPYVLNETNGMELENMYLNATDTQRKNIIQLRKDMSNLRLFTTPGTNLSELSFIVYILILAIITLIIYPLFNLMYKNNPIFVTYIVSIGLVIVLCIFCIVSFISKILP